MSKNKFIVDEIIQKFETAANIYIKLGSISGNVNENNEDILDEECTIVIPKSKLNNFHNQFNEATRENINKITNKNKKEEIKIQENWLGKPLNFKK